MVEEVVLADGAHVGTQAFAGAHVELLERQPLPLGGGLDDLGIDPDEVKGDYLEVEEMDGLRERGII